MKIFLGVIRILIWPGLPLLDAAFSANTDLGTTFTLHLLKTVATGTHKQPEEVDLGKFLDRDVDFI